MKYNFSEIKAKDLDGKERELGFHKSIAQLIYTTTKDINLVDKAFAINRGEEVELSKEEIAEVERVVNDEKNQVFAFARKAFKEYIDARTEKK